VVTLGDRQSTRLLLLLLITTLLLVSCGRVGVTHKPPISKSATPTAAIEVAYANPVAYCAAAGNIDEPSSDPRYTGPGVPRRVVETYAAAADVTPSADFLQHPPSLPWRCMGGGVYVCVAGLASGNGCAPAKTSSAPTARMEAWCASPLPTPAAGLPSFVPSSETDNPSIYTWECRDGHAVAIGPPASVDARGFIRDHWRSVPTASGTVTATVTTATAAPTPTP
jgi:hypothetical protein